MKLHHSQALGGFKEEDRRGKAATERYPAAALKCVSVSDSFSTAPSAIHVSLMIKYSFSYQSEVISFFSLDNSQLYCKSCWE